MKKNIFVAIPFALIGIVLLVASMLVCLLSLNAPAIMVGTPKAAQVCAQDMLDAVSEGDYTAASQYIYGQPQLGVDREPAEQTGQMLWMAYVDSFSYELTGGCYATPNGVALNAAITSLDISSVGNTLADRMEALLTARIEEQGEISEIYDENGDFQDSLIQEVLQIAFKDALEQDALITTQEVALNLTYQDGRWWIVPDQALLQAISGGVIG